MSWNTKWVKGIDYPTWGDNDVYKKIYAEINNKKYDDSNDCYPTIHDGIEGMKFIETVLESSNNNSKWIKFNSK